MWKYRLFSHLWGYGWERGRETAVSMIRQAVEHHKRQGLDFVEYRAGFWGEAAELQEKMQICAEALAAECDEQFTARYIVPLPRPDPLPTYQAVRQLLQEQPQLTRILVGLDFASQEEGFPPRLFGPLFQQLHQNNEANPEQRLTAVYHVGESFFDKSLESAVRWCHEAALLGAKRLGHCIALGLDPSVAVSRRPQAHEAELVSERLDQIAYDLRFASQLRQAGVAVDVAALQAEQRSLASLAADEWVERPYTPQRFQDIRLRQTFVLNQLTQLGIVIECCPTSNLRIGGVPDAEHHPIHRLLASRVNLCICTDDPGTFDITLASEIEWVLRHTSFTPDSLAQRLGDPRRFKLAGDSHF
jgi:adenosine deaminase